MNCAAWQPMQDVLTPMKNAGKLYKLILKLEKGQTNTAYVNLFNGLHILSYHRLSEWSGISLARDVKKW